MRPRRLLLASLLITTSLAAGCGGGGADGDLDEVVAVWPFAYELSDSDDFASLDVGFAEADPLVRESVILATGLGDGEDGLRAPVGPAAGGPPWAAVASRLTDGQDSNLAATVIRNQSTLARRELESANLLASGAGPDLAGFEITALQVRLDRLEIGPDDSPPVQLRVEGASTRATRAIVEGAILVRGRPLE